MLMSLCHVFADNTGQCKYEGIPGAYVYVTVDRTNNTGRVVNVRSYGVSEGTVTVVVTYHHNLKDFTKTYSVDIRNGVGQLYDGAINVYDEIKKVEVYNAVCTSIK